MDKIVIGIPTFKRPVGLKRLLNSIEKMNIDNINVMLLVADNEGDTGVGIKTIQREYKNYPIPIYTTGVKEQGISNVRNELMNEAFTCLDADFLAMVDDDETVHRNWLYELLSTQKKWNSDVVSAKVLPHFEVTPPTWTNKLSLYWRKSFNDGPLMLIDCTTSILMSKTVYQNFKDNKFNPGFGLTGGGDKEFFTRLKSQGASFSFSSNAISYEYFGESRLTREWAKQRSYRIGSADMRIIKGNKRIIEIFLYVLKAIVAIIYHTLKILLLNFKNTDKRFLSILKTYRQLGKLSGFFNRSHRSYYERIHGD